MTPAVGDIVKGVPPFPKVRECLDKIIAQADLAVVSGTPGEALEREWEEHHIEHYPKLIAGQELGTKTQHLAGMTGGGKRYEKDRMLMVGDAPGDFKAARAVGLLFFPVNPGRDSVDGDPAYASVADLPVAPDIIDLVVPATVGLEVVRQALDVGYDRIWVQPGAESPELLRMLQEADAEYLAHACIMVRSRVAAAD